jgi:branched-chain amino acid transport system ATP-binding protein
MPDLLQVENLAKRFGGIVATDDLSIAIPEGQLHAVIGPNGAGKTTLIAQLSGQLTPDSGHIQFAGSDITALPMPARSALGLARSFQITSLFLDLSVLDNVALAVQAHAGHSFHFWRDARGQVELRDPARAALGESRAHSARESVGVGAQPWRTSPA